MKKRLMALMIVAVMVFALCGCGSSGSDASGESAEPEVKQIELSSVKSNSDAKDFVASYYAFELEGKSYTMPCPLSDITANGWYVPEANEDVKMDAMTWTIIYAYPDEQASDTAFMMTVLNDDEKESKPISECKVTSVKVGASYTCKSMTLKRAGITVDVSSPSAAKSSADALKSAYGTDENYYSENNDNGMFCEWRISNMVDREYHEDTYVIGMGEGTQINEDTFELEYAGRVQ